MEKIVISNNDGAPYAVVSVGGFLGIGEKQLAVPLQEMTAKDGALRIATDKAQMKQMRSYEPSQYRELNESEQVSKGLGAGLPVSNSMTRMRNTP